jgi:hypothetical protein
VLNGSDDGIDLVCQLIPVMRADDVRYEYDDEEEDDEEEAEPPRHVSYSHLDGSQATEIRRRFFADEATRQQLADECGVTYHTVCNVLARRTFTDGPLVAGEDGYVDPAEGRERRIQMRRDQAAAAIDYGPGFKGRKTACRDAMEEAS